MEVESGAWSGEELVGGDPCLDLVNTAGGGGKARDLERLTDWPAALGWALAAGLLDAAEAARLGEALDAAPAEAEAALRRLRAFREALHTLLLAIAQGLQPPAAAWDRVEVELREARGRAGLRREGEGFAWSITVEEAGPETFRLRAAEAAGRLLTGGELARLRNCERCSWLYLDRSRGGRRRWCSMATCGNRAKAQRHYRRRREGGEAPGPKPG